MALIGKQLKRLIVKKRNTMSDENTYWQVIWSLYPVWCLQFVTKWPRIKWTLLYCHSWWTECQNGDGKGSLYFNLLLFNDVSCLFRNYDSQGCRYCDCSQLKTWWNKVKLNNSMWISSICVYIYRHKHAHAV